MSTTEDRRILMIGLVNRGGKLADSPLLVEAGALATHPQVEWLFFYQDNIGIITDSYREHLITGYPVLNFGATDEPFTDRISRELFSEFFTRFLFAKKIQIIITTTLVGLEIVKKIAGKSNIGIVLYQRESAKIPHKRVRHLKNVEVVCTQKTDSGRAGRLFPVHYITSLATLIESKMKELNKQ
ncbi:hypothetical protein J7M23_01235 [Candidatus Sumerlaeota bacterium]|nr:hypothetical protein [Candidatus Sumerlaeota bacterium]